MYAISNGEKANWAAELSDGEGNALTVRTLQSNSIFVALADRTNVVQTQGSLKLRKSKMG
jgi:hypothetical protein